MITDREPLIVVLGMGPVGMTAALKLARQGLPVTVLEAGDDLSLESRASTFHPSSLQILDELGVIDEVLEMGLKSPGFQYRGRNRELIAHLDMSVLAEDTKFPFRIQLEQSKVTRLIRKHLEQMPHVTLRLGTPVERVELATDSGLIFLPGDGLNPSYRADWVIAADGAASICRRTLGIAFEGVTYPERFLVASTTHEFEEDFPDLAPVSYIYDPEDWGVLLRTPSHWRVLFPIDPEESSEDALNPDRVEERLQGVVPLPERYPLVHSTIYAVHQRIAQTFGVGRFLLAGDAAHINNPLGGMGMNSGIHDGDAAVAAINYALAGGDPVRAVEVYSKVRRDVAALDVQMNTQRNYEEMREKNEDNRHARRLEMERIAKDPDLSRAYLRKAGLVSSLETSRRRMARGLTPTHTRHEQPAGRQLSDMIRLDALLVANQQGDRELRYLNHGERPASDRDLAEWIQSQSALVVVEVQTVGNDMTEWAREVRALERSGVSAVHLVDSGDAEALVEAIRVVRDSRKDMLVFVTLMGDSVSSNLVSLGQAAVSAGADLVGVAGVKTRDELFELHQEISDVPLLVHSEKAPDSESELQWTLAGVNLVLPTVKTPARVE